MHLISSKPILQLRYLPVWECVYSVLVHGIALSQRMEELIFGVESLLTCFVGYVWSDKSPVKFTNWNPQEPDSHQGQQPCVEMYSTGDWADTGCYSVKQYICKMPRCKTKHSVYKSALGRMQRNLVLKFAFRISCNCDVHVAAKNSLYPHVPSHTSIILKLI